MDDGQGLSGGLCLPHGSPGGDVLEEFSTWGMLFLLDLGSSSYSGMGQRVTAWRD